MVALVHPVFDCLMRLAQPDALMNEEEVRKSVDVFLFLFSFIKKKSPIMHVGKFVQLCSSNYNF